MTINRPATFGLIKSCFGVLKQSQVDSFNLFFDEWDGGDKRHLAYILATVWHETSKTMLPIEEYGKGKGKAYEGEYYGRGYVQLTWEDNYDKAGKKLGIDLVKFPWKALNPKIAIKITFLGMSQGWFTGKKLRHYFSPDRNDPINARKIINGLDCAEKICDYYNKFYNSII